MLVIYDNSGKIYFSGTGFEDPDGIPFIHVDIPANSYLEKIDTSKEPHEPVFKKYPLSELDKLKLENEQQQADLDYLLLIMEG